MSKRVCVIGAGACGLVAAKVFAEHGLLPAVFEQSADVGGQWRYDASVTAASTSAMYEHLQTNLPSDVMQLSDFPFPPGTAAFPHHAVVLRYLEDYAAHWKLRRFIAFQVKVELVESQPQHIDSASRLSQQRLHRDCTARWAPPLTLPLCCCCGMTQSWRPEAST